MKVCIVGMGYIGLPTALMMAASGVDVVGTDLDGEKILRLRRGEVTFEEQGMTELFARAREGKLEFSDRCVPADIYVIAVPTPYDRESKKIDPAYVVGAVNNVLDVCPPGAILSIESTISPGTVDRFVRPALAARGIRAGVDVHLAHTPERIIPGNMIYELEHNSRTVGADEPAVGEKVKEVYASFCKGEIVLTDIRTAEMSKVVENTFRDINIAFANELAKICRKNDMDVYEVIRIANKHPRVNILSPGPGVGGHCISVDPWFLVGDFPEEARLIRCAREVNSGMPAYVLQRIRDLAEQTGLKDLSRVGLYGLTYKEDVDDTRESPTLQLLEVMAARGCPAPVVYDPMVTRPMVPRQAESFEEFLAAVDLVVIMVGHSHLKAHADALKGKTVLDTRHTGLGGDSL